MRLFDRIMRIRKAVVFRHESGLYGSCYPGSKEEPIVINLCLHTQRDPCKTYVHECLHILYPTMSERNIRKVEEYVWKSMSAKQRFLLSRKLYNRKWRTR